MPAPDEPRRAERSELRPPPGGAVPRRHARVTSDAARTHAAGSELRVPVRVRA